MGIWAIAASISFTLVGVVWFHGILEEKQRYFDTLCDIIDMTRKARGNVLVDGVYRTAMDGIYLPVRGATHADPTG